jgi:diguanylate cyclase (GGDEF)-like protein
MNKSWRISLIISFIVLFGAIITSIITYQSYSTIVKTSTRSISELSAMGVYSEINNELTKPIYISTTMASDSFVKDWLTRENSSNQDEIITYLDGVHKEYDYNSVFLVSTTTGNYYHYNELHKVVSPTDSHDVWYYDFLASNDDYDLDVDVDEVTGILTIFINVKMYDAFDNVSAVVGVGVEMAYVKEMLDVFEEGYDLTIYLTEDNGVVQTSTNIEDIETLNVFETLGDDVSSRILSTQDDLVTTNKDNGAKYIISRYIDELDWYLIVTKDTNILAHFFLDYLYASIIMVLIILIIVANIIRLTINKYQDQIYTLAKTDYLTLLLNRRGFNKEVEDFDPSIKEALIFILDIDQFKIINDQFGHSTGDKVLRHLANLINQKVSVYGKLSRWGGDEFTGYMIGERDTLEKVLIDIMETIQSDPYLMEKNVTISLGYTYTDFSETLDQVLTKADHSLYQAKKQQGNAIVSYIDIEK